MRKYGLFAHGVEPNVFNLVRTSSGKVETVAKVTLHKGTVNERVFQSELNEAFSTPLINPQVFEEQKDIQRRYKDKYPKDKNENFSLRILQLLAECFEVLDLAPWKPHRRGDDNFKVDRQKLLHELIDIYKFWMNILILFDITPEEITQAHSEKHEILLQRLEKAGL